MKKRKKIEELDDFGKPRFDDEDMHDGTTDADIEMWDKINEIIEVINLLIKKQ